MFLRPLLALCGLLFASIASAANQPPTVVPPSSIPALRADGPTKTLDLNALFQDPDPGTQVRVSVRIGSTVKPVDMVLFDSDKPITTANFKAYINEGRYMDNFFHRSVPGFVVQGGGFRFTSGDQVENVPTFGPIANEFGFSNLRGTIAMAKLGGDPNSATSQWFVNLANNAAILDGQNGGFTVFGRVLGNGMAVIDEVAALPRRNAGGAFGELPVKNHPQGTPLQRIHRVETDTALLPAEERHPTLTYTAGSANPGLVAVTVENNVLKLTPSASGAGTVVITVVATDLVGATASQSFDVTVAPPGAGWRYETSGGMLTGFSFDRADAVAPASPGAVTFGDVEVGSSVTRSFSLTNRGSEALTGLNVQLVGNASDYSISTAAADSLAPNESTSFTVTFSPTGRGVRPVTLRLSTDDPDKAVLNVPMSGTGLRTETIIAMTSAYTGTAAPRAGSGSLPETTTIATFGVPAISDVQTLAARVTLRAGIKTLAAIYGENQFGVARLFAYQTGTAHGIGGTTFKTLKDPVLAPNGAVAFGGSVAGAPLTEDEALWTDLFGTMQPVLREGRTVPGLNALKIKAVIGATFTSDALVALLKLSPGPGTIAGVSDTAVVRVTAANAATLLVKTGAPFSDSTITGISILQPAPLSPGQGRWQSGANVVAKLTLKDRRTLVVRYGPTGAGTALVQAGLPDAGLETTLTTLGFPALGGPAVAVLATEKAKTGVSTSNDSHILFAADGADFVDVAREGNAAPNVGSAQFAAFRDPLVNAEGELLFQATLRGAVTAANRSGLWWSGGDQNALSLLARQGDLAVDEEGQPIPNTRWVAFSSITLPDGAAAGPLFVAKVNGSATNAGNNTGAWAVGPDGVLRLLLRTGALLPAADGAQKKVASIALLNALPGSFGVRRSYNSTGSIALRVTFAGGSQAIVRIDLPLDQSPAAP